MCVCACIRCNYSFPFTKVLIKKKETEETILLNGKIEHWTGKNGYQYNGLLLFSFSLFKGKILSYTEKSYD